MTKRAIDRAAKRFALELLKMVGPVLFPAERLDFYEETYRLCRSVLEACRRQAGRERCLYKPSMN
jgi:hypothetical protein